MRTRHPSKSNAATRRLRSARTSSWANEFRQQLRMEPNAFHPLGSETAIRPSADRYFLEPFPRSSSFDSRRLFFFFFDISKILNTGIFELEIFDPSEVDRALLIARRVVATTCAFRMSLGITTDRSTTV